MVGDCLLLISVFVWFIDCGICLWVGLLILVFACFFGSLVWCCGEFWSVGLFARVVVLMFVVLGSDCFVGI